MRYSLSIVVGLLLIGAASAQDGYWQAEDTYWYYGREAQAYTRKWVPPVTTYARVVNGCYQCATTQPGYYLYTRYYAPVLPAAPYVAPALPDYKAPDALSKLVDIAAARDKYESQIRVDAFKFNQFKEGVAILGLSGNFRLPDYGYPAPHGAPYGVGGSYGSSYGTYGNYNLSGHAYRTQNYGASASSIYGVNPLAPLAAPFDVNAAFQVVGQHTANAQKYGADAIAGTQEVFGTGLQAANRIAEIQAKGQTAVAIINSLQAAPSASTQGFKFTITPAGSIDRQMDVSMVNPKQRAEGLNRLSDHISDNCAACHSPVNLDGSKNKDYRTEANLDLTQWPTFTFAQKERVLGRLTRPANDPRRMPPPPARPLSPEEIALYATN